MVRCAITAMFLGLLLVLWAVAPADGGQGERDDRIEERLERLERELIAARRQGNDAEVVEIEALLAELREGRGEVDEEDEPPLQERLEALQWELEVARQTGNEAEVAELQELIARLTGKTQPDEGSSGPHADTIEVTLDDISDVQVSSATCGFALVYKGQAASQVAVMESPGIVVGSICAGGTVTVAIPIENVEEAFRVRAMAEIWDGQGAAVSVSVDGSKASWVALGSEPLQMEATGEPQDGGATVVIQMRGRADRAAIRLWRFELIAGGETYRMSLPVATVPIRYFPRPNLPAMHPGIERALIEWDWRMQDGIGTRREPRTYDRAIEVTFKRGDALISHLAELGVSTNRATSRWYSLRDQWRRLRGTPGVSEVDWGSLWREVHRIRRQIALANPLAEVGPIAFVKCVPTSNSIMQQQYIGRFARPGGGVFVLQEPGRSMRCRSLTQGRLPPGAYQHLDVSYDGGRLLFCFCKLARPPQDAHQGNPGHQYDIYEVRANGSELRSLIASTHDDIAPRYLPDGNIVFMSTRRGGYSRCGPDFSPCHTLTLAHGDGSHPRLISFHEVHEYDPAVMNDGRIVYTRWDYVDREASLYQQLWVTRPDGTNPAIYYGNNTFNPMATFEPRAIPGSNRIMAIAGCHHSIAAGSVVLVDVTRGVDDLAPLERLTPDALFPETEAPAFGWSDGDADDIPVPARRWPHHTYKSPLPLSEDFFLVSYSFDRLVYRETEPNPANMFGLYLVDRFGNKELLYRDLNVSSLWPMPLRARPGQVPLPKQSDPTVLAEGTFYVQNVYEADPPLPEGVKIEGLRIIHLFPRTSEFEVYPTIGLPVAACGRQVLGTVPVEEDGSAYFKAPARKALAFQALDELGQSVQFMRSVTYLQPGEAVSCVGCHEHRMTAPPSFPRGQALKRPPSSIRPGPDGSKPFSYPRLVQPILDKHCVQCHGGRRTEGDIVLTGGPPRSEEEDEDMPFSASYLALAPMVKYAQWAAVVSDEDFRVSNSEPVTQPDFFGSRSSPLIAMLREGHEGVELSDEEFERLVTWADNNALFYGTFDPEDQARQLSGKRIEGPVVD